MSKILEIAATVASLVMTGGAMTNLAKADNPVKEPERVEAVEETKDEEKEIIIVPKEIEEETEQEETEDSTEETSTDDWWSDCQIKDDSFQSDDEEWSKVY